jgi:molecular chaperone GrpE
MTKKKKDKSDEMNHKYAGDLIDNKDDNTKNQESFSDNTGESAEITGSETDTVKTGATDGQAAAEPDKGVKKDLTAEEKLAEMQDRYLRLSAEFDNYRKRTLREKIELTKHAGENILLSIIPVMDDFERAMKLMETASDCVAMKTGIDLIYSKFNDFLKQHGIREIEALYKDFDVDLHEAVTKVPVQDQAMKGKVVDVLSKGYWLHDKVMRFSKVVVGE